MHVNHSKMRYLSSSPKSKLIQLFDEMCSEITLKFHQLSCDNLQLNFWWATFPLRMAFDSAYFRTAENGCQNNHEYFMIFFSWSDLAFDAFNAPNVWHFWRENQSFDCQLKILFTRTVKCISHVGERANGDIFHGTNCFRNDWIWNVHFSPTKLMRVLCIELGAIRSIRLLRACPHFRWKNCQFIEFESSSERLKTIECAKPTECN